MIIGINVDNTQEKKEGVTASGAHPIGSPINYDNLRLIQGGGYSGTSSYGISHAPPVISSPHEQEKEEWVTECKNSTQYDVLLVDGMKHLEREASELNSLNHLMWRDVATKAIGIGTTCITQKNLCKKAGRKWSDWAPKNITFMSFRNVQKYMLLAERVDCHQYTMLGVDRLETLCSATKEIKGVDAIGLFMSKHGITLDPTQDYDLDDFKLVVDTALNKDLLENNGILNPDPELLKILTKRYGKFGSAVIRDLKNIQGSGGDTNTYLRKLADAKASELKEERQPKDFNNMSGKLIKTIDYILRDEDQIDKVSVELFKSLFQKMRILGRAKFGQIEQNDEVTT